MNYRGDDGNNTYIGSTEDDRISGGGGNDWFRAQTGDDTIRGDDGNDRLIGETGSDRLSGGAGDDTPGGPYEVQIWNPEYGPIGSRSTTMTPIRMFSLATAGTT